MRNKTPKKNLFPITNCIQLSLFLSTTVRRIGHPYVSRASPKRKPYRHTFTPSQVIQLESLFEKSQYLSSSERVRVAKELNMTDNQIKTWYQNRRTKLKREITEMYDQQRLFTAVNGHSP